MRKGIILVVDDDEDILRLVSGSLKARGFDILTATTGAESIGLCNIEHPDRRCRLKPVRRMSWKSPVSGRRGPQLFHKIGDDNGVNN